MASASPIPRAHAVQIDWNGQFWFDNNWLNNYQLSRATPGYDNDPNFNNAGGAYVPGVGEKNVTWYTAFARLKPKVVVNDNIYFKSELDIGSPVFGFLGRGYPASGDEAFNFTGASKDSMAIAAQRYWVNLITDFGTIELGRAPIHWGLGAMWDSGDELFQHYRDSGDMIRLTSKFGNFFIQPALVKIAVGNNVAGASDANGLTVQGNDDVTDYDLAVKYDNSEEEFEFGMMWTKRTGNAAQKSVYFNEITPAAQRGSTRINFNIFDFYSKKKWGHFWVGGELPLVNGSLGAVDGSNEFDYKTLAIVGEAGYTSDMWDVNLKAGHVPGQPPTSTGDTKFRALYLNKDYKLGLLMFNYNIYGLASNNPDTVTAAKLQSPWDAEIVNANYFSLTPAMKLDKWTLHTTFVFGYADTTARAGSQFFNYNQRKFYSAVDNQSSFLGWEWDLGVAFRWDENLIAAWDLGVWHPGGYYAFLNSPDAAVGQLKTLSYMFGSQVRVGVNF